MEKVAPICLFTFNRLDELKSTINALKSNYLAKSSDLFIFSDGPRNDLDVVKIKAVREYIKTITGFKNVFIKEACINTGLAGSIIAGVSEVIVNHGRVIVLEDDLITSKNFLNFMNCALNYYELDENILSISGYTFDLKSIPLGADYYFGLRASSWGWATWKKQWEEIDWEISDVEGNLKKKAFRKKFRRGGSDMVKMLNDYRKDRIDSWAIRFCYHQSKNNLVTVFPSTSKVNSIGFSVDATHTKNANRFSTKLDPGESETFNFNRFVEIDSQLERDFRKKFSLVVRLKDRLKNICLIK